MAGGIYDPVSLGGRGGFGDVTAKCINGKDPLRAVVLGGVFTPWGPLLTDDYGRPIRFSKYGDGPCRFGDTPVKRVKPNDWFVDRVCVLDDKTVASFKHDVFRFVVEACRLVIGGDGDHDRSVVLCREGVAEQLGRWCLAQSIHGTHQGLFGDWSSRRAPSLVGMLSISSAPWSAAQESQNALICNPMPSRRCFLTTAIPSMRAACSAKASRICAAWTPLVPVRYMSVSATQRAGWMRAAPIRRSCPHTPMYVGLIVPSSCLTTAGTL